MNEIALILIQNTLSNNERSKSSAEQNGAKSGGHLDVVAQPISTTKFCNSFNPSLREKFLLNSFYNGIFTPQPIMEAPNMVTVDTVSNPPTVSHDPEPLLELPQNEYQQYREYVESYHHILYHNFDQTIHIDEEPPNKSFTDYVEEAKVILTEHIVAERRKQLAEENLTSIKKPKFKPNAEVWFQRWRSTWLYLLKKKIQHKKALAELDSLNFAIPILREAISLATDAKQYLTEELVLKYPDAYAQFLQRTQGGR